MFDAQGIISLILEDTTIEDVLKTFQEHYAGKDYEKALQTLHNLGHELPAGIKHYNLGTVYAEIGELPLSRYHLLLAQRNGLSDEKVLKNLRVVETRLEVDRWERPLEPRDHFVQLSSGLSGDLLVSLSLVILIAGLILLRRTRELWHMGLLIVLILIPLGFNFWVKSWPWSMVLTADALQTGPSAIFGQQGEIPAGVLVLARADGEWAQVIYPARFAGWIRTKSLKRLE
jgi:hypothetical protein